MADIRLESLVVRGVPQANVLVADMVREGSKQVNGLTSANLSYSRHPSHRFPGNRPANDAWALADDLGEGATARLAGRPGSLAGVPVSRKPARFAGRAVLWGWPAVCADGQATAAKPFGNLAKRPAVVGTDLRTLPLPSPLGRIAGHGRGRQRAWRMSPARGMRTVSTRGMSASRMRPSRASRPASR